MSLSQSEIIALLNNRDFETLIGEFENEWLECKGQPFDLSREDQKLELAKDVSSLANANGGLLLIGFATTRPISHGEDCIDKARPFPLERFDKKQYQQILSDWIYPKLEKLDITVFPSKNDESKGVAAISVPAATSPDRPVLIAKTILENSQRTEILFGYCARKQAHIDHYDIERIHTLLRDGGRLDADIRDGFQSLHSAIAELRDNKPLSAEITPEDINNRTLSALSSVGLQNMAAFVLSATPFKSLNLRAIFESKDTDLVKSIEHPPEIRFSGFDLNAGGNSRIVEGAFRRSMTKDYKSIEVHRDGAIIYVCTGGLEGLCWGRPQRQTESRLVNQVALIETIYLFMLMLQRIYDDLLAAGEKIGLEARLLRMSANGKPCRLEAGPTDSFSNIYNERTAPANSKTFSCDIRHKQISPERAAVLLISDIYAWFGFEEDQIPYTKQTEDGRVIDVNALSQLR